MRFGYGIKNENKSNRILRKYTLNICTNIFFILYK